MKLCGTEALRLHKSTSPSWIKNWHQLLQPEPRVFPPKVQLRESSIWKSWVHESADTDPQTALQPAVRQFVSRRPTQRARRRIWKWHAEKNIPSNTAPALLANLLTDMFSHCCHRQRKFFFFFPVDASQKKNNYFDGNKALHLLIWRSAPQLPWKHFTHSLLLNTLFNEENGEIRNFEFEK